MKIYIWRSVMGNEKTPSTQNGSGAKELIDKYINEVDEKGKLQLPDSLSEVEKELIRQAKRTRDAQSALGKKQLEAARLAAEKAELEKIAREVMPADFKLSEEEIREIEQLKTTDPEAYRIRVNKIEEAAKEAQEKRLKEIAEKAKQEAENKILAENRLQILEEFRASHPDIALTDEILVEEVPPRFMKELNEGKYDYREYLNKVVDYLQQTKVIPTPGNAEGRSLGNLAGGKTPGQEAANNQGKLDYKKLTF